jgi:succinate dehydrogenase / fumarate reductase membrane anchor subunit
MNGPEKTLRSRLGQARGLGSAHEGVHHWWAQRMSALALIPLSLWLVAGLVCNAGADYAQVAEWLSRPLTIGALGLTILAATYHAVLGLQVVIEDYIHTKATKLILLVLLQLGGFAVAAAAIVSLLVIAFAG